MKSIAGLSRTVVVVLSLFVLLMSGCGGSSDSTPAAGAPFTAAQVSGKTFAYSSSKGDAGTLTFKDNGTWDTTVGTSAFSGTWNINSDGKLVCVTTSGGNHTVTYTLLSTTTDSLTTGVIETNPSDPANPASYTATLKLSTGAGSLPTGALPDDALVTAGNTKIGTISCRGTLSQLGRWCDNLNGTVKDMYTGLIWLQDASWGGQYPWWDSTQSTTTAFDRIDQLKTGNPASFTESVDFYKDWRLPTMRELSLLGDKTEPVSFKSPRFFINVKDAYYWSSSTYSSESTWAAGISSYVWLSASYKISKNNVWPVRSSRFEELL